MNKKHALFLFGEYRTFDLTHEFYVNNIPDNVDVYISTWNKSLEQKKGYIKYNPLSKFEIHKIPYGDTKRFKGRIESSILVHRIDGINKDVFESNGIRMDIARHEVKVAELAIQLTSSEFKALSVFLQSQGRVFTRNQIMEKVHGEGYVVSERAIDVMIVGLRKKLGEVGACIETIRGIGYRLMDS